MASVAEPEVQFAQRLASNEKSLRRKALKKLRSYISARSRTQTGFSEEELLKLWKGLFYCLWMQDKPVLQEELSTQISGLVHHFHSFGAQLQYLQTFLTTVMREWTGIDCLRMDKFFQLVRFMFRQMFVVLHKSQWDSSCVRLFLELLSSVLLQTGTPPVGLQLHVLDLYLRELAVIGALELSADQNLVFIEPFCKSAAKTKDRALFRAICNSIFSTIIDQAPFAIQDLMDELEQDSDDQEESEHELKNKRTHVKKNKSVQHRNGLKMEDGKDDNDDNDGSNDDSDDDGLSNSEKPFDEDVGPVLQFDYGAVADRLLELSSRHNTPSRNRKRLYKIIKVLRDLSQGVFPQDEYPEEVSTDEDDDFGSRKRMKRKPVDEDEEDEESEKRVKGKKKKLLKTTTEQNGNSSCEKAKKKRKKKKKKPQSQTEGADTTNGESTLQPQPEVQSQNQPEPPEPCLVNGHTETKATKRKRKPKKKTVRTEKAEDQSTQSEPELLPKSQDLSESPVDQNPAGEPKKAEDATPQKPAKKKKQKKGSLGSDHSDTVGEHQEATTEPQPKDDTSTAENTQKPGSETLPMKKAKKRKVSGQKSTSEAEPEVNAEADKKKKKRKKIPVEFEYEAEEVQTEQTVCDTAVELQTPLKSKPQKIHKKHLVQPDFVSFQSSSPPAPLFCRAQGPQIPQSTNMATSKGDNKKVRFGLKNNQTAEFHKSDRSLLLSPKGTARVPFDPEQKPKCGVLKSPPTPFPKQKKKATLTRTKKKEAANVQTRPTAADFF